MPPEPRSALGQALEAERRGNNVRAAILRTQVAPTLDPEGREMAVSGARAALGKLVDALGDMFTWDHHTRQEWRQALAPLLEPAAAGIWPRAARCLYELQKIPADTPGCIFSSRRSAEVVTGLNATMFQASFATPYGPAASTGFHVSPSL